MSSIPEYLAGAENGIYLQLSQFVLVLVIGLAVTRLVLVPAASRLVSGSTYRKLQQQVRNFSALRGLFA